MCVVYNLLFKTAHTRQQSADWAGRSPDVEEAKDSKEEKTCPAPPRVPYAGLLPWRPALDGSECV